jgi:D-alanyl-D-alanine dipeptidase
MPEYRPNKAHARQPSPGGRRHGAEEWWHYTLRDEPFPDTCFDFPIEQTP